MKRLITLPFPFAAETHSSNFSTLRGYSSQPLFPKRNAMSSDHERRTDRPCALSVTPHLANHGKQLSSASLGGF